MLRGLLYGIVLTLGVLALGAYAGIRTGVLPANADARPGKFERWAAGQSLRASVARGAPATANPVPPTAENLTAGLRLYAANCAVCHGTSTGKASATRIARGLYQAPPQFADEGIADDPPGVVYWKVRHGIRLTGMPSFSRSLTAKQLWQVSLFVQSIDKLPPSVRSRWKALKI
ncbi:MAG: cytochrome c [Candidatus Eremiobacteraeota bacterium]|nr:cytochrome c [Candidatus Eremiobacteraeota bacterium]